MSTKSAPALFGWPIAVISATAFAVVVPFFFWGNASGHDFEFHMNSWMEVVHHWKLGIVYPGWAGFAHYGFGEARFIFYPPLSWTLGGLLGTLLPWKVVPGAYIFIALTLSGSSMFVLARRWLDRADAIFTACVFAANPYHLVIVYWRSAFAELLAAALLPLLLHFVLRLAEGEESLWNTAVPLSFIVAAAWMTNIPVAVMVNYSLALFIVVIAGRKRSLRVIGVGALAVGLGAGLAAIYLLPIIHEQKWVNISEVLSPGVRPADNFLFTRIDDVDHNLFNLLVSLVALCEIVIIAVAIVRSRKKYFRQSLWKYSVLWSIVSAALMIRVSSLTWRFFPELKFVQLPWRWLLCLNVAFAILVTFSWRRWASRVFVCAIMLVALGYVWHRVQQPWPDNSADIAEMFDNQNSGAGYEGTDEYVPAGTDASNITQNAPLAAAEDDHPARINIQQWTAESKTLEVDVNSPANIALRLFDYPAWKVEVNGRPVTHGTREDTGQMVVPVPAGLSTIKIKFARTWDRMVGAWLSLTIFVSIIFLAGLRRGMRRRSLLILNAQQLVGTTFPRQDSTSA